MIGWCGFQTIFSNYTQKWRLWWIIARIILSAIYIRSFLYCSMMITRRHVKAILAMPVLWRKGEKTKNWKRPAYSHPLSDTLTGVIPPCLRPTLSSTRSYSGEIYQSSQMKYPAKKNSDSRYEFEDLTRIQVGRFAIIPKIAFEVLACGQNPLPLTSHSRRHWPWRHCHTHACLKAVRKVINML